METFRSGRIAAAGAMLALAACALGASAAAAGGERVRLTGMLLDQTAGCPALRAADGAVYGLVGDLAGFGAGDEVAVAGFITEGGACRPGPTIAFDKIAAAPLPDAPGDVLRIEGVLTGEGVECPALRGDDGRLYTLVGDLGGFRAGDRVRVAGEVAAISYCQQGTTLRLREATPAG